MTGGPPNYDPRPPKDRRIGGVESNRSGRRTRESDRRNIQNDGSFMRRITGRNEMERAKAKRYEPYGYESNLGQLRWLTVALIGWVVVSLMITFQDRATVNYLSELRNDGFVSIPPTHQRTPRYVEELAEYARAQAELTPTAVVIDPDTGEVVEFVPPRRDLDTLFEYAAQEGMQCVDEEDFAALTPDCTQLINIQTEYTSIKDTGSMYFVLLVVILLGTIFVFGSFTHRASRNVLALNNENQNFTPEKAVLWFFIPFFNLIKPWQVFKEIFRGSDPDVTTSSKMEWKTKGKVPAVVHIWALIFVGVFFFNPRTIGWFWYSIRENLDDVIVAHQRLIIADLLMAVLGVAAILVVVELHRRQEARHAKVGDIIVTPPPPVDPLEEALKEGIRRKELENRRARSRRRGSSDTKK